MSDDKSMLGRVSLERDCLHAKITELEKRIAVVLAERVAVQTLADAGVGRKALALVLPHLLARIRVQEATEKRARIFAVDAFGNPGPSLTDLVAEFKRDPEFADLLSCDLKDNRGRASEVPPEANPFLKGKGWNVTHQILLQDRIPALAKYLEAVAKTAAPARTPSS